MCSSIPPRSGGLRPGYRFPPQQLNMVVGTSTCSPLFFASFFSSPLRIRSLFLHHLQARRQIQTSMVGLKSKYDLARGHPNPALLPVKEMKDILLSIANDESSIMPLHVADAPTDDESDRETLCLNYGHEAGSPEFLDELQSFLTRHTATDDTGYASFDPNTKNEFFITHGVSHGIDLLCSVLTAPGDVVWVERPTYFLVANIFRSHNLTVRGMPMIHPENSGGTGGIDVKTLIAKVEDGTVDAPKMIYFVPVHQNPTGYTMPVKDRKLLSEFALKNGVLLVGDEVYHLLDWSDQIESRRPARIAEFNGLQVRSNSRRGARTGACISVSSFTKIFAPGVRVGWVEAPDFVVCSLKQHGYIQSQGGCAPFVGDLVINKALQTRVIDTFLSKLIQCYATRARRLCDILQKDEKIGIPNGVPTGGYFLWIKFPLGIDAEDFLRFCVESSAEWLSNIRFRPGAQCDAFANDTGAGQIENDATSGVTKSDFRSYARLCFADLDESDLLEGGRCLVKALEMYTDQENN